MSSSFRDTNYNYAQTTEPTERLYTSSKVPVMAYSHRQDELFQPLTQTEDKPNHLWCLHISETAPAQLITNFECNSVRVKKSDVAVC